MLDNPLVLPGAGVLIALLAGLGFYRLRSRARADSGETSFLESRLQPDSFFGASGGQRIDTRDAPGGSSSMSYSLSQLDAIGDVDPVAEADVYLAYGRDLQAEEILKEAMRANPDRHAIRTKLLEVYAKRRDTKGFELLATQLYTLTRGEGEDWAKAQELGISIDPENPLYQPGGQPAALVSLGGGRMVEPLGASTMPQSVLPSPSQYEAARTHAPPAADRPRRRSRPRHRSARCRSMPPPPAAEITPPLAPTSSRARSIELPTFELPGPDDKSIREADGLRPVRHLARPRQAGPYGVGVGHRLDPADRRSAPTPSADPLARKLELAEEFRQIGDTEGARDLLHEVIAKASGTLKSKAQTMLPSSPDGAAARPGRMRLALGISYRGGAYHGWQSQPDGRTVQDRSKRR